MGPLRRYAYRYSVPTISYHSVPHAVGTVTVPVYLYLDGFLVRHASVEEGGEVPDGVRVVGDGQAHRLLTLALQHEVGVRL